MIDFIILSLLPSISISEDEKVKLLLLKRKSLYILTSIRFETHPGIQRATVSSNMEFIKLELYPYIFNVLFLANPLNVSATEPLSYVCSNNIKVKKVVKLELSFYTRNISATIKKID